MPYWTRCFLQAKLRRRVSKWYWRGWNILTNWIEGYEAMRSISFQALARKIPWEVGFRSWSAEISGHHPVETRTNLRYHQCFFIEVHQVTHCSKVGTSRTSEPLVEDTDGLVIQRKISADMYTQNQVIQKAIRLWCRTNTWTSPKRQAPKNGKSTLRSRMFFW